MTRHPAEFYSTGTAFNDLCKRDDSEKKLTSSLPLPANLLQDYLAVFHDVDLLQVLVGIAHAKSQHQWLVNGN